MKTKTRRWYRFGTVTHANGTTYTTWQDWNGLFNITRDGNQPGHGDGGYTDLCALLALKGLDVKLHRHELA